MSDAVTALVPVWNRRDLIEHVVRGLRAQTMPVAELLVIDDGSSDGSADAAASLGARTVRMETHGGFARAVNRGIRECRTPLLAIVNDDVDLAPDWLEHLVGALTPDAWFATGRILQAAAPDRIDATYDEVCRGGTSWRVGHAQPDGPAFQEPRAIRSAPMTAALFRTELFSKVGLLDERFESYLEDVDFGLRCAVAGCAGRYVPDAVVWHQGSATLGRWHPETVRYISRNQVFLLAKHYSPRMLVRYAWPIAVAQGLWGFVALRHGQGWSWMRGKIEGLAGWRRFRPVAPGGAVSAVTLREGEREIARRRPESGADLYWTLYFLLTAGGAK